jgi:hypothetical protein
MHAQLLPEETQRGSAGRITPSKHPSGVEGAQPQTLDIDFLATLPASMVLTIFIEELMSRPFMSAETTVFQLFFTVIDPKYTVIAYAIVAGVVDQPIHVSSI